MLEVNHQIKNTYVNRVKEVESILGNLVMNTNANPGNQSGKKNKNNNNNGNNANNKVAELQKTFEEIKQLFKPDNSNHNITTIS